MNQEPHTLPADQQDRLAERLCALVETADAKQWSQHRLGQAVSRWSRDVPAPTDVLTLVAAARARSAARTTAAARREQLLDRVLHVGVAAVAERLVHEALTDSLTGLATRARLEEEVQRLIAVAVRTRSPLTAVMIDVDGLKRINDEQGHHAGDEAIAAVGRAIREHTRTGDRAFRWGGDEFVVFMPGTSAEQARVVVERVQRSCPTATTAGVATHSGAPRDTDVAGWLKRADTEMYQRREASRAADRPELPAARAQRPRHHHRTARPSLSGLGLVVLAATVASGIGWLGATQAARTFGVSDGTPAKAPRATAPATPRPAAPTAAPTAVPAVTPTAAPAPVVVVERQAVELPELPERPALPRVLPTGLPPQLPTALPTQLPTQLPTPEPSSVLGGLVDTVGDLLDGLL